MSAKLEELRKDLEELVKLQEAAVRPKVKDALALERRRWETDLATLQQNVLSSSAGTPATTSTVPKRYIVELTNYAFDQSDAFVKLFVTLDGVQVVPEEGVTCEFTDNSLNLLVKDLNGKDYNLIVKNLLEPIDVSKSYRKIKSDLVAIYMKKVQPGKKWDCLTKTEKKVKDIKSSAFADLGGDDGDSKDPSAGIMNMMKKMYESGDSDTKRMIAKAWTEAQDKRDGEMKMPEM